MEDDKHTVSADQVLGQVLAWQRDGQQIRERLLARRQTLVAELADIDAALALMPAMPSADPEPPAPPPPPSPGADGALKLPMPAAAFKRLSMPLKVQAIVEAHPGGIRAPQVVEIVRLVDRDVDPALVHSGLYRALNETIRSEGTRGTRIYYPLKGTKKENG